MTSQIGQIGRKLFVERDKRKKQEIVFARQRLRYCLLKYSQMKLTFFNSVVRG